ncbi:MAG: hypothetical protein HZC47_07655 [Methanobacterium sp.]|uniref:hypothetical protein n=1 Tax=Methanobacterium sp. TaxID=2164 RepID=UPI003D648D9F|nr:hypothetical protein [Methanobacterium sp.]
MGTIEVLIMVALFIVLMVFVFSTALLTPVIGKKNLIFVLGIGFIVGIIGGAFFISPVADDLPSIANSFYHSTSGDLETLNIDISTNVDINQYIANLKNVDGVKSVEVSGITVKTAQFSDKWKNILSKRITISNKDIKSAKVLSNDSIMIEIKSGSDPQLTLKKLNDWLMLVGGIDLKYSLVHATAKVETAKVNSVSNYITKDAVVTSVEGPTQEKINSINAILPDKYNIILICGFIGFFVGLAGVFIDTLIGFFENIKKKIGKNE